MTLLAPSLHQQKHWHSLKVTEAHDLVQRYRPPEPPTVLEWAEKYRCLDDRPFSLSRYPYLIQIYQDHSPFIVVQKPNQVGISEWLINVALHALDVGGAYFGIEAEKTVLNVGYIFPAWSQLRDFSKERIRRVAGETPYLTELLAPMRQGPLRRESDLGLYFIRKGAWYLRGGHNPDTQLASFPVDLLIVDEYDLLTLRAVSLAEKRLRASPLRWKRYVSKPTLPGQGINKLYLESDQQTWEIRCPACGEWQSPDFWENVVRVTEDGDLEQYADWSQLDTQTLLESEWDFACRYCLEPMQRTGPGRWRAQNPGAPTRGYLIPGLVAPYVPLAELVKGSRAEEPDVLLEWHRADLGLAKAPEGGQLKWADLEACKGTYEMYPRARRCTMGVDVGVHLHVRIGSYINGQWHAVWIGEVDERKDLDELMTRYDVRAAVIDGEPETRMARDFCLAWPGRAWMADYSHSADPQKEIYHWTEPTQSSEAGMVKIARTEAMDRVAYNHRNQYEALPANAHLVRNFYAQMMAPVRVETKRQKQDGTQYDVAVFMETGPDHYYHSSVYEQAAREKLPPPTAVEVGVSSQSSFV